jgi:hypothetical protein
MTDMSGNNEFNAAFFDDASAAWRSNKITRSQGTFNYCCQHVSGTRKKICGKKIYVRSTMIPTELLCWAHCRSNKPNDASTSSAVNSDES